jgi:hypothetical protein
LERNHVPNGILGIVSRFALIVVTVAAACGGPPIARNLPAPNKAAAAGMAAGAAAAITLIDPQGAAAKQEELKPEDETKPQKVQRTVPADVFDRLDAQQAAKRPGGQR